MSDGVKWMYHATAMSSGYDALLAPLARLFGCRVLHDAETSTPGVERRGGMTWLADGSLEIGEPFGETSPVHRFLARFGGGMHSVAVQVEDLGRALAHAAAFGVRVAHRVDDHVAFTRPVDTAGLLIEWNDARQSDDPRWGAPPPAFVVEPTLRPAHLGFVGALVEAPEADGRRLAELLDTDLVVQERPGPGDDEPRVAIDLGDCMLALYPMPAADRSRAIWGAAHDRARCLCLGLVVDDLDDARDALAGAGVGVHHRTAAGSLVAVGDGLPFPVVLTDRLLTGDRRAPSAEVERMQGSRGEQPQLDPTSAGGARRGPA